MNRSLQITRSYEPRGMLQDITSSGTGGVVNDVLMSTTVSASSAASIRPTGANVATSGSPSVQYAYSSGTANTIRPTGVTYPAPADRSPSATARATTTISAGLDICHYQQRSFQRYACRSSTIWVWDGS